MRLAERVKSWLRKLGPSDEVEEIPVNIQESRGTGEDVAAVSQAQPSVAVGAPSDTLQKEPSPRPPLSAQQPDSDIPAATVSQTQPQPQAAANGNNGRPMLDTRDFFSEAVHAEANRYTIKEVIGKGSYGVVCSAVDNFTGEKVAIKKITNVFEHVSDATRIVREIKLLRLLKHPDIVDIKHIMLPPSPKDFRDIYVVFELLETDLHQVIKANDDLTPEHHQFFLYQMLRGLKYIHSAKVFHRDLKPKNILANSDCKLKICDFGLARPAFTDVPTTVFWTDYVATRWYRAPELCGSFYARYSPAIDIWSVGCIFAEVLLGRPLFPGRNVVHQLELITDLLGTPSADVIAKVRNEKARRFLLSMQPKPEMPFELHFLPANRGALRLLRRLLAFDPAERPTAEEALADPYFTGMHCVAHEPVAQPLSKMAFDFDRRKLSLEDVRELIYREILEYHPQMLADYLAGASRPNFHYPSALESFKRQFAHLEAGGASLVRGQAGASIYPSSSLPKEWVADFQAEAAKYIPNGSGSQGSAAVSAGVCNDQQPQRPAAVEADVASTAARRKSHAYSMDGPDGVQAVGGAQAEKRREKDDEGEELEDGSRSGVRSRCSAGSGCDASKQSQLYSAGALNEHNSKHHQQNSCQQKHRCGSSLVAAAASTVVPTHPLAPAGPTVAQPGPGPAAHKTESNCT